MNGWILQLAAAAVSVALLVLTAKGALALTGSIEVALVLAALVVIQWVCAHKALVTLRWPRQRIWWGARLTQATSLGALWLAAALVTVPLVGAELFALLAAERVAEVRLVLARDALLTRAAALQEHFTLMDRTVMGVATYAEKTEAREIDQGGTCWPSRGNPTGKVRNFWLGEAEAAKTQAQAMEEAARWAKEVKEGVQRIETRGASAAARKQVADQDLPLEQLRQRLATADIKTFVTARKEAGSKLARGDGLVGCSDTGRNTALEQSLAVVNAIPSYERLAVPPLLDPTDHKAMAQGSLMRTWATVLQVLPKHWLGGRALIDQAALERYGVSDKVLISDATLPLALAWILEAVVLALMALQQHERTVAVGRWRGALQALVDGSGAWLAGCRGPVGRIARRAAAGMDLAGPWREAPRTGADFFTDATMRQRAGALVPWRCAYGGDELILVPLTQEEHLVAARELELAGLLRRQSSAVRTKSLLRDARLAPVLQSRGLADQHTHWAVFRVVSERFAAWLLAQHAASAAAA